MNLTVPSYDQFASRIELTDLLGKPGREHYRLLAYLSTLFNNQNIIDITTQKGAAAYALSYNEHNTVYTFEGEGGGGHSSPNETKFLEGGVKPPCWNGVLDRPNIKFILCDLRVTENLNAWSQTILSAPIIFVDVELHQGHFELSLY